MTWAQSSGRHFSLAVHSTPAKVSPCSYDVVRDPHLATPDRRRATFKPRETLPPPDFITPGPGSYGVGVINRPPPRPKSSFFASKTLRDSFFDISRSQNTPSCADYGQLDEWVKKNSVQRPCVRPPRYKRVYQHVQHCNYLDEKGRMVYVKEDVKGPNDIGPGSYNQELPRNGRTSLICPHPRNNGDDWIKKDCAPPPDSYIIEYSSTRLPVSIKEKYKANETIEVNDRLSDLPMWKTSKRPTSVFASKARRDVFQTPKEKTPGPPDHSQLYFGRKEPRIFKGLAFGSKAVYKYNPDNGVPGPSDYSIATPKRPMNESPQFMSRTQPAPLLTNTPENVGPGSYNVSRDEKIKAKESPAFLDGIKRVYNHDNGNPAPDAYDVKIIENVNDVTFLNTRYPKKGDWLYESLTCSPSPETYNIPDAPKGPSFTFPKEKIHKRRKKEAVGPGSYNTNTSSMLKPSFNSGVPRIENQY